MFRGKKERQVINNNVSNNNGIDKNTNNVSWNIRTKGRFINSRQGFPSIRLSLQLCWESPSGYHCVFLLNGLLLFDKSFECRNHTLGRKQSPFEHYMYFPRPVRRPVHSRPLIFGGKGRRGHRSTQFFECHVFSLLESARNSNSVALSGSVTGSRVGSSFGRHTIYQVRARASYMRFSFPRSQQTGSITTTDDSELFIYLQKKSNGSR